MGARPAMDGGQCERSCPAHASTRDRAVALISSTEGTFSHVGNVIAVYPSFQTSRPATSTGFQIGDAYAGQARVLPRI
ncbi:hypothetical protein BAUCODRAFT_484206 [Baudoinia panamericana UAMH 10762]|uniref:Uncharacterized protein n=1 Tax=Baudoinia panamericana (strain UAMH 10762) TaxID=717646 RepID=M2MIY9_BAUPA|nr:uncharacterized protein BAUCODRAFT_484206 [Baudoinia panamericana UAMH 10762]EMC96631.1 hypothetical protein BAUCODRAFT_484206 [Baudoinia panamericana UAMH 10762]